MKSTAIGSAVSVLLVFSAISHSRTYSQEPKPVQPIQQPVQPIQIIQQPGTQTVSPEAGVTKPTMAESAKSPTILTTENVALGDADFEIAPQTYTATAYSLSGRTASGKAVSRGLIAADPRVLPLGTRVRLEAGTFSGEYVVADTGGSVKGRRIDIWTPSLREARQFGRRAVKLTVLSLGGRRSKSAAGRPRRVNAGSATAPVNQPADKQEE